MVSGSFPKLGNKTSNEILLSQVIAKRLSVGVGDEVSAYFQNYQNQQLPNVRRFKVVGLFLSGFPDFDENFVLGDWTSHPWGVSLFEMLFFELSFAVLNCYYYSQFLGRIVVFVNSLVEFSVRVNCVTHS